MIQRVRVNLIPSYNLTLPVVHLKQYDQTDDGVGKQIELELYSGDDVYEIPSNAVVTFQGTKTDKKGYQYEVSSYEGNLVTVDIKSQMTVLSGTHEAELRITVGESIINTTRLVMDIDSAALADDTAISDTELPLIQKAVEAGEKVEELRKEIEGKQDQLVSGTNIKTVNNQSLLGSGNIEIQGGGSGDYNDLTNKPTLNGTELKGDVTITTVSEDAKNIATNTKNIATEATARESADTTLQANIDTKQDTLVSGTNIKTINNQSLLGSENVAVAPVSHATSKTTYGVGTTDNYGHNKVIDNLTSSSFVNGEALSANQGRVLNDKITNNVVKVANAGWGTSLSFTYNKVCQCLVLVNGTVYGAIWFPNSVPTLVKTGLATETVTLSYSSSKITLKASTSVAITVFYI